MPATQQVVCLKEELGKEEAARRFSTSGINDSTDSSEIEKENRVNVKVNVSESMHVPGAEKGGRKLAMIYTCKVCETRSIKQFTEQGYKYGVVIATCPGCQSRHLLADNLGYFQSGTFDLEQQLTQETDGNFTKVDDSGVMEVSLEALLGQEKFRALVEKANAASKEVEAAKN